MRPALYPRSGVSAQPNPRDLASVATREVSVLRICRARIGRDPMIDERDTAMANLPPVSTLKDAALVAASRVHLPVPLACAVIQTEIEEAYLRLGRIAPLDADPALPGGVPADEAVGGFADSLSKLAAHLARSGDYQIALSAWLSERPAYRFKTEAERGAFLYRALTPFGPKRWPHCRDGA